jgi:hypothetical protein
MDQKIYIIAAILGPIICSVPVGIILGIREFRKSIYSGKEKK